MNIADKEFFKLPFRVNGDIDYKNEYPSLQKIPEFSLDIKLPFDVVFKYIVLYYSNGTPLMNISNPNERKGTAADLAGFDITVKSVQEMLSGKNEAVNQMIISYLRLQKSHKWSKLIIFIDAYYNQLSKLQSGEISGEKTKEILVNVNTLETNIDSLTSDLLNEDRSPYVADTLFQSVEDTRLGLRPEEVAEAISEGRDPLRGYNPYK